VCSDCHSVCRQHVSAGLTLAQVSDSVQSIVHSLANIAWTAPGTLAMMTCNKLLCDAGCFLAGQLIHLIRLDRCALPSPEQCPPLRQPPRSGYTLECLHVALALVTVACNMFSLRVIAFLRLIKTPRPWTLIS